jgi:hypothetical protein
MPFGGRNSGMYQLVIDVGNSNTKIALYHQSALCALFRETGITPDSLEKILDQYKIASWVVSSVVNSGDWLHDYLSAKARAYGSTEIRHCPFILPIKRLKHWVLIELPPLWGL